ncbi:hypothetical protein PG_1148 [Porphyromonas gingivalis W83]|uniref:Uncharacterized protein n=1 Tax=Porphyromonas gingivalis (strain ATCC BAA-308 / W83) TaxID=242619 RepID=Q7MVC5_PORGI|nr:hypothetical protein PG_1148 [Porphyromonas gingivalis W83]AKV64053.1 hypothetical protein PGA7_00008300 [Porphyromonas gingivalis]
MKKSHSQGKRKLKDLNSAYKIDNQLHYALR